MDAELWTAIGSIGTLIGLALAVIGFAIPMELSRRSKSEAEAAAIRGEMLAFRNDARDAKDILTAPFGGASHVHGVAADRIIEGLIGRLGASATSANLWDLLSDTENRASILGAIASGTQDGPSANVERTLRDLRDCGSRMTGGLRVFSVCATLLSKLYADGCVSVFQNALSPEGAALLHAKYPSESIDRLRRILPETLAIVTGAYFEARYDKALPAIVEFVEFLGSELSELSHGDLLRVSRMKRPISTHQTYTDDLRDDVRLLRPFFAEDVISDLLARVDQIQKLTSKDTATQIVGAAEEAAQRTDQGTKAAATAGS